MALIVIFVAGYVIAKSLTSTTTSAVITGMRAVVVPTENSPFMVVVAPCGTGASVLSSNASAVGQTTGATSIRLPQGQGERVVLIPACTGGRGGTSGTSPLPSAAFVPPAGTPIPPIGTAKTTTTPEAGALDSAQFELTVPAGSPIKTVVVSPCEQTKPSGPAQLILSSAGNSSTAVAPAC